MPVLRSAKKRIRSSETKRVHNDSRRRAMRDYIKSFKKLLVVKDVKGAQAMLPKIYKVIDKATKIGVIKKNTASRKKSRLTQSIKRVMVQ